MKRKMKNEKTCELTHIFLSSKSKKAIKEWERKCKKNKIALRSICNDIVLDIETGRWYGPCKSYEFIDLKNDWEKVFHGFFDIPDNVLIEIDCFNTGILSFDKRIYPKWHNRR